nr:dTDP-4-amino-4,6-dideoxygalactose transaminase [uncultured Aminipila sp.]
MIKFNEPIYLPKSLEYIRDTLESGKISGDGKYTKACNEWFKKNFNLQKILLTTSGTHALELASMLMEIDKGDEVIIPSYTFTSTANAFVTKGARIKFVDIRKDTLNIDETLIEQAITRNTKAIVPVHYAGVACDMDSILDIARRHDLFVCEDAAQGVMSKYKGKYLGTMGDFGCYSFHETKNYSMGEGGAVCVNQSMFEEKAEIIREKGTNRSAFIRGEIDKYTWISQGSSYLPSDINAAMLLAQLEVAEQINEQRLKAWNYYYKLLKSLETEGILQLPQIPENCVHNAHMFFVLVNDCNKRDSLLEYMKKNNIMATFHYIPLHLSPAGLKYGSFVGDDKNTISISKQIIRLPLYYGINIEDIEHICKVIEEFFKK